MTRDRVHASRKGREMARIIVIGGGVVGLTTAMLLARDGHDVTVLERDPARAARSRRRVERLGTPRREPVPHAALLPAALPRDDGSGAARGHRRGSRRSARSASTRCALIPDGDHRRLPRRRRRAFTTRSPRAGRSRRRRSRVRARRRPTLEVRRGVAVAGLLDRRRVGERHPARRRRAHRRAARSCAPISWSTRPVVVRRCRRGSTAIGAAAPVEEIEDCGFMYYGRHFRSSDGSIPPIDVRPRCTPYGTVSMLTLPADNGTWGVGIVTSAQGHRAARG